MKFYKSDAEIDLMIESLEKRIKNDQDKIESLKREKIDNENRAEIKNQENLLKNDLYDLTLLNKQFANLEREIKELKYTVNSRYDYIDRMRSETQ